MELEGSHRRGMAAGRGHDPDGICEETGVRRPVRAGCGPVFRESRGAARPVAGMDRNHRVRASDLFRFLGLYRYRHRGRSAVRFSLPREFPPPVPLGKHHRVLAAMAYDAFQMAARLHLYIAGRKQERRISDLSEPDVDDASGWSVARRELEFRDLGRLSRRAAGSGTNGLGQRGTNWLAEN